MVSVQHALTLLHFRVKFKLQALFWYYKNSILTSVESYFACAKCTLIRSTDVKVFWQNCTYHQCKKSERILTSKHFVWQWWETTRLLKRHTKSLGSTIQEKSLQIDIWIAKTNFCKSFAPQLMYLIFNILILETK